MSAAHRPIQEDLSDAARRHARQDGESEGKNDLDQIPLDTRRTRPLVMISPWLCPASHKLVRYGASAERERSVKNDVERRQIATPCPAAIFAILPLQNGNRSAS
jgi:hypothetical protein